MFKSYERLSIHDAGAHAGELKASGWSSHDWDSAMKSPLGAGLIEWVGLPGQQLLLQRFLVLMHFDNGVLNFQPIVCHALNAP